MSNFTCQDCRKQLSPFLDGELPDAAQRDVEQHLETCAPCRARFDAEAAFETQMRAKLAETAMPAELWADIQTQVRRPKPRTIRFPLRWPLATAACVALIAVTALTVKDRTSPDTNGRPTPHAIAVSQSVADLLSDAAPELTPFTAQTADDVVAQDVAARLAEISRTVLGKEVSFATQGAHHAIVLIDVMERVDARGTPYVEVRLNCCGHPVLLALARSDCDSCISELRQETGECEARVNCRQKCGKVLPDKRDVKYESRRQGDLMIAAATADHYLKGVWAALRIDA